MPWDKKIKKEKMDLLGPLEDELEFFFSSFLGATYPTLYRKELSWKPPTDFYETEDEFVIILELAQIRPEEVQVTFQDKVLAIRGVRKTALPEEQRNYHKMEINYGPFEQKLVIMGEVDMENLSAHYSDGFLEIRLPKKTAGPDEVIDIKVE